MRKENLQLEQVKVYHGIRQEICRQLIENWPREDRLPPIKELAKKLGTGQSNTHRAVKELTKRGILVSRPGLGTFLNNEGGHLREKVEALLQTPEARESSDQLAGKWVQLLSYATYHEELGFRFQIQAINSVIQKLSALGARITQHTIEIGDRDVLSRHQQSDAIVIINAHREMNITCGPNQVLTLISTDQYHATAMEERFDFITVNDKHGSFLAGNLMRRMGWKDVCFIGVREDHANPTAMKYDNTSADRLEGFEKGLGQSIRPEFLIRCGAYLTTHGGGAVSDWLKITPRPSAIFAASDDLAFGFIVGALAHGLQPGRDYQLIGFDGQQSGKNLGGKTLTTVAVPMTQMGISAAKFLAERLANPTFPPRQLLLGCTLIEGNTVVPAASINTSK